MSQELPSSEPRRVSDGHMLLFSEFGAVLDRLSPEQCEEAARIFLETCHKLAEEFPGEARRNVTAAAQVTIRAFSAVARHRDTGRLAAETLTPPNP